MEREIEDELRELRREIVESRGLVIKTNNLSNALAADLKSIARRQQSYEQRISWNSATAYVVFIVLVVLGVKILWDYRVENIGKETDNRSTEVARLSDKLKAAEAREEARLRVEQRGVALYELARVGKRAEFLEQFDATPKDKLTRAEAAMLADVADRFRNELATERYLAGIEHLRVGRFQEGATALEESLRIKPESANTPNAKYSLAMCLRRLNRQREAIPILAALAESSDHEMAAAAQWELALAQIDLTDVVNAKSTLRAFVKRWPEHPRIMDARQKLGELQLR